MHRYAQVISRALHGVDAPEILIEVQVANGLPAVAVVGLPETSVKESRDRVKSALMSIGFQVPPKKITINLAPADLPKQGGRYDLSIAIGIFLAADALEPAVDISEYEWLGELGLNGELRPVKGVLPSIIAAKNAGRKVIVPMANLQEAKLIDGAEVYGADHLSQVLQFISGQQTQLFETEAPLFEFEEYEQDLADIRGQTQAKRVLEVCASGGHSLMLVGPPGSGKSMLASRLVTLLPPLSLSEAIEVATIDSICDQTFETKRFFQRKLVSVHHSTTVAAMVGGGSGGNIMPGAISRAHKNVLFLDEISEFKRSVLEALREPLETKRVDIARANSQVSFPADAQVVCALNPTPSGFFEDDTQGRCTDTPEQILKYRKKLSGPLLDRIDCHLEVPPVDYDALTAKKTGQEESSREVRARVLATQKRQITRQGCLNAQLTVSMLETLLLSQPLDQASGAVLKQAVEKLGLSARAYHRLIRVARTLADMANCELISVNHIVEAISYRSFDMGKR